MELRGSSHQKLKIRDLFLRMDTRIIAPTKVFKTVKPNAAKFPLLMKEYAVVRVLSQKSAGQPPNCKVSLVASE